MPAVTIKGEYHHNSLDIDEEYELIKSGKFDLLAVEGYSFTPEEYRNEREKFREAADKIEKTIELLGEYSKKQVRDVVDADSFARFFEKLKKANVEEILQKRYGINASNLKSPEKLLEKPLPLLSHPELFIVYAEIMRERGKSAEELKNVMPLIRIFPKSLLFHILEQEKRRINMLYEAGQYLDVAGVDDGKKEGEIRAYDSFSSAKKYVEKKRSRIISENVMRYLGKYQRVLLVIGEAHVNEIAGILRKKSDVEIVEAKEGMTAHPAYMLVTNSLALIRIYGYHEILYEGARFLSEL